MTKWIKVTDETPPMEVEVLASCKRASRYRYQCIAFYLPDGVLRQNSSYNWDYECCDRYDEQADDYYVNPGWYESLHNWDEYSAVSIEDTVTHWMPLPALPEGKNG